MKKELPENAKKLREQLSLFARTQFPDKKSKILASEQTGLSFSAINNMLYNNDGGLDAWVTLLSHAYDIKTEDADSLFIEIKKIFLKKKKLSQFEIMWSKLGDRLSDDEKYFWHQAIETVSGIKSDFSVKQKK